MTEKELLAVACEQFLGKNVQDVKNVVLQTLEGHLRSILGADGLTVLQASRSASSPCADPTVAGHNGCFLC